MTALERWLSVSLADLFGVDPASLPEQLEPSRSRREQPEPSPGYGELVSWEHLRSIAQFGEAMIFMASRHPQKAAWKPI